MILPLPAAERSAMSFLETEFDITTKVSRLTGLYLVAKAPGKQSPRFETHWRSWNAIYGIVLNSVCVAFEASILMFILYNELSEGVFSVAVFNILIVAMYIKGTAGITMYVLFGKKFVSILNEMVTFEERIRYQPANDPHFWLSALVILCTSAYIVTHPGESFIKLLFAACYCVYIVIEMLELVLSSTNLKDQFESAKRSHDHAAYPGYRTFLMTCKLTGCCFVNGLWTKQHAGELSANIAPSYVCYCVITLLFYVWSLGVIVTTQAGPREGLSRTAAVIFYGFYILVYVQAAVNAVIIATRSARLLEILRTCAALEAQLHLRRTEVKRRLTKVSRWCLALAILDSIKYVVSDRKVIPSALRLMTAVHDWIKIVAVCLYCVGVFLVGMWFGMTFWLIVYNANVMREYFAGANETLVRALVTPSGCARTLQNVRLHQAELRRVLLMMNSVLGIPSVLLYGQGVFFMCATTFGVLLSGVSVVDRILSAAYAVSMAVILIVSAKAAHNMTSEANRIKDVVQDTDYSTLSDAAANQL
ncbi:hypothetical protein HPB52_000174 [Rhipicephalus sanguineus]|uniref:Uncharacterized protein n=1 Tax=Rhipicephalus sanguineus TaxID=34632 RepID=A0A9D4SPT3_RHISA|nr:hypothetical protein HPB52_000174 [Rhipicephalus sanguineus]